MRKNDEATFLEDIAILFDDSQARIVDDQLIVTYEGSNKRAVEAMHQKMSHIMREDQDTQHFVTGTSLTYPGNNIAAEIRFDMTVLETYPGYGLELIAKGLALNPAEEKQIIGTSVPTEMPSLIDRFVTVIDGNLNRITRNDAIPVEEDFGSIAQCVQKKTGEARRFEHKAAGESSVYSDEHVRLMFDDTATRDNVFCFIRDRLGVELKCAGNQHGHFIVFNEAAIKRMENVLEIDPIAPKTVLRVTTIQEVLNEARELLEQHDRS